LESRAFRIEEIRIQNEEFYQEHRKTGKKAKMLILGRFLPFGGVLGVFLGDFRHFGGQNHNFSGYKALCDSQADREVNRLKAVRLIRTERRTGTESEI